MLKYMHFGLLNVLQDLSNVFNSKTDTGQSAIPSRNILIDPPSPPKLPVKKYPVKLLTCKALTSGGHRGSALHNINCWGLRLCQSYVYGNLFQEPLHAAFRRDGK